MPQQPIDVNDLWQLTEQHTSSGDRIQQLAFTDHRSITPRTVVPQPINYPTTTMSNRHHRSQSVASTAVTASSYSGEPAMWSYEPSTASTYAVSQTTYTTDAGYNVPVAAPAVGTFRLPCEFVGFSCDETFHPDETDAWIEHIITVHLRDQLPRKAVCWFCDTWVFDSSRSGIGGDRRTNFDHRMWHVRDHILEGKTDQDMRPDYHMLEHLRHHKLISEKAYLSVRRWDEKVPKAHLKGIYAPSFVPPERALEMDRKAQVIIDHHKEDRAYKKNHKHKSGHRGH